MVAGSGEMGTRVMTWRYKNCLLCKRMKGFCNLRMTLRQNQNLADGPRPERHACRHNKDFCEWLDSLN